MRQFGMLVAAMGLACLAGSACASSPTRASTQVPLATPEPPPRVAMPPVAAAVEDPPPPPEEPTPVPPPAPAVRKAPPPSPAPASAAAPAPAAPTVTEPAKPNPAPELRPAGPAAYTTTAAQVQESLRRTKLKLDAIDRRRLNPGRRADFDSARRFLAQAEGAVKANNLLLAQSSAEKAATLADGLN